MTIKALALIGLIATATAGGCAPPPPPTASDTARSNAMSPEQQNVAVQAGDAYRSAEKKIVRNAEIDNLARYMYEMTRPGELTYVVLFNAMGQPIAYYAVNGPVTDCNRELTPMQHPAAVRVPIIDAPNSAYYDDMNYTADSPNDEGTYGGGNNKCVFFYTTSNVMVRWTGDFLQSDQPIRLSQEPVVINVHLSKEGVQK